MSNPYETADFWAAIAEQLTEARQATSATRVCEIMPPVPGLSCARAAGLFAGGGDDPLDDALRAAGWTYRWSRASYHWCMQAPDGSLLTYIEGDLYQSDRRDDTT